MPVLDAGDAIVEDAGVEFVLAARASDPGDVTLVGAEDLMWPAVRDVVDAIYKGQLE